MKKLNAARLFAGLAILLGAMLPIKHVEAQIYCPKNVFGTDGVKPTAGMWWLCINYLQQAAQSGGPFASLPVGDIFVGNPSGSPAAVALSGDATLAFTGALTVTKTGGVAFAASATTDTTNAANIGSGTLPAARLPAPTSITLGGVESFAAPSHQFVTGISTSGIPQAAQPAAADVSGLAASATTDTTNAANISSGVLASARGGAGAVSGILTANGSGATSAAVSGTDYAPATSGSSILKGNGAGGTATATAGTDYETPANVSTAIGTALPSATASQLYGGTGAAGAAGDITLGTNLSITGGVLNAAGGSGTPGGSNSDVQYAVGGAFAGNGGFTYDGTSVISLGVAGTSVGGVILKNATSGSVEIEPPTGALGTTVLTTPGASDTLVGRATPDTLTNKSIAASEINSGQLSVANGGTGLASGTSGGIPCYTATGTLASSALLSGGTLLMGGGVGVCPSNSAVSMSSGQMTIGSGATIGSVILNSSSGGNSKLLTPATSTGHNITLPNATGTLALAPLSGTSASIGGGALTAGTCATGTVTITGATTSMVVTATPVTFPGAGFDWNRAYVSGTDTVTVQVCADVAGTPTASAYNVRVLQ